MSKKPSPPSSRKDDGIDSDLVRTLLTNEQKKLELEGKKLQLHERQIDHNLDYSKNLLQVQGKDLINQREHERKSANAKYMFVGILVSLGLIFLMVCLFTQNLALAIKIIESAVTLGAGAIGGFYFGERRGRKNAQEQEQFDPYDEVKN